MELKNDEFQALRLKVDQISSELDKQNTVRVVNTKWMIIVGAVILASLGFTSFVQLPREAARAAREQVGPEIISEANEILSDLRDSSAAAMDTANRILSGLQTTSAHAKDMKKELGEITELQKIANLPVGTIVPSMLEPIVFAKVVGDVVRDKPQWVLADGRAIEATSRYSQKSGKTDAPDLRGVFLRGMNVKGGKDPQQNRTAGNYQEDAFARHHHGLVFHYRSFKGDVIGKKGEEGRPALDKPVAGHKNDINKPGFLPKEGKDETRPKNVAVYFYIKIN